MVYEKSSYEKAFFLMLFTKAGIESFVRKTPLTIPPKHSPPKPPIQDTPRKVLKIPPTKIPLHLQYLKSDSKKIEIDFGRIDSLIFDPLIKEIECNGPNEFLLVRGIKGTKEINLALTKEEINNLVKQFSDASKIPVHEGLFKVFVNNFAFSAIISEITGSKFIITKQSYNPLMRN